MSIYVEIEKFCEPDWPEVWEIIRCVTSAGETYTYPTELTEDFARTLWLQAPPGQTVVARDKEGAVLGSAKMGPNQMGPGAHVATASFMVSEAARGQGVGRALGQYAVDWARDAGFRSMQFNAVVETNEPAVRLWKSLGFRIIGTVPEAFRHPKRGFVGLFVMHRALSD